MNSYLIKLIKNGRIFEELKCKRRALPSVKTSVTKLIPYKDCKIEIYENGELVAIKENGAWKNRKIQIKWVTRCGQVASNEFNNVKIMKARLKTLDEIESNTARHNPTDSGSTRFNYNAESFAILKYLEMV